MIWRISLIATVAGAIALYAGYLYQSGVNAERQRIKAIDEAQIEQSKRDRKELSNANDDDLCRSLNAECLPIGGK